MLRVGRQRGIWRVRFGAALLLPLLGLSACKGPWSKEFKPDEKAPNRAGPVIPAIPATNVSNSGRVVVPFTISDADGPLNCNQAVSTHSSDITVVPATSMDVSGTAPNCIVTVTPAPGATGTSTITLTVNDGTNITSTSFDVTAYGPPSISGTPVRTAIKGLAYAGFSAAGSGGLAPYTYSLRSGSLPAGMTLNTSTGAVSGTPTADGLFSNIVIRVSDAGGGTADLAAFDLYVAGYHMDFTASTSLDASVSFSRTSSATRVNATGGVELLGYGQSRIDFDGAALTNKGLLIEEARSNLLRWSENFEHSQWAEWRSTVTANNTAAPDGSITAERLAEQNGNDLHYLRGPVLTKAGASRPYTFTVFAKANGRSAITLRIGNTGLTNGVQATCNLGGAGSTSGAGTTGAGWSGAVGSVTALANGWYRCRVSGNSDTGTTLSVEMRLNNGTSDTYTGSGGQGVFLWGAQLEQAAQPSSYIPGRNIVNFSEALDQAPWSMTDASVTADFGASPNGTFSADRVTDSSGTAFGYARQALTIPADGSTYTGSVYVGKGAPQVVAIYFGLTGGTTLQRSIAFDTADGDYTRTDFGAAPSAVSVSDAGAFWRVSFAITNNSTNNGLLIALMPAFANALTGSGLTSTTALSEAAVGSALFWGVQVETGTTISQVLRTTAVATERDADHAWLPSLGSWFAAAEGTMVTSSTLGSTPAGSVTAASFTDGSLANRIAQLYSATSAALEIYSGGGVQAGASRSFTPSGTLKTAGAYLYNDSHIAVGGALGTGGATGSIPTVSQLNFGFTEIGSGYLNGHVRSYTYWNKRLPNALLQSVSQ